MSNLFRRLRNPFLAPLLSVTILVVLWIKADARFDAIAAQLGRLDLRIVSATLMLSVFWHSFIGADKWWRILRAMGAPVRYWEVFRVRMGSDPIRSTVPLKVGSVVNAAYFARLKSLGFARAAGSVVFDKALNFFGQLFWLYVGLAALAMVPTVHFVALHTAIALSMIIVFGVRPARHAAVALAGYVHTKLGDLAAGVLSAFEEFSLSQKIGFLIYGALFQLRPLAVCGLLLLAFQPARLPTIPELMILGSVVVLLSNLPSVGGIGPREAAVMASFADFADQTTLLTVGLMMSLIVQVVPAIIGIPLMFPLLRAITDGRTPGEPS